MPTQSRSSMPYLEVAACPRPVIHRHGYYAGARALKQRRQEAVHVIELRQLHVGRTAHHLDAAARVRRAIAEHARAHAIRDARLQRRKPVSLRVVR